MPFSKSDFDEGKQGKYKAAIASAAGAPVDNVDIVSITEKRRRAGSVDVETKVLRLLPSPPTPPPESGYCAEARWWRRRRQKQQQKQEQRLPTSSAGAMLLLLQNLPLELSFACFCSPMGAS